MRLFWTCHGDGMGQRVPVCDRLLSVGIFPRSVRRSVLWSLYGLVMSSRCRCMLCFSTRQLIGIWLLMKPLFISSEKCIQTLCPCKHEASCHFVFERNSSCTLEPYQKYIHAHFLLWSLCLMIALPGWGSPSLPFFLSSILLLLSFCLSQNTVQLWLMEVPGIEPGTMWLQATMLSPWPSFSAERRKDTIALLHHPELPPVH